MLLNMLEFQARLAHLVLFILKVYPYLVYKTLISWDAQMISHFSSPRRVTCVTVTRTDTYLLGPLCGTYSDHGEATELQSVRELRFLIEQTMP